MTSRRVTLVPALLTAAAIGTSSVALADPLASHRWVHRVLVAYVPATPEAEHVLDAFEERVGRELDGLRDRDVVIALLREETARSEHMPRSIRISGDEAHALRTRLRLDGRAPTLVLIGKDGGTKLRQEGVFELPSVFEAIDLMPMRRAEIERRR